MIRRAVAGLALLLALTSCSGTREARTPVYLVVAEGETVGLVASPLPPDTAPERGELTWLEDFAHVLDGDVVDLAVARELPTQVFAAYRTAGGADLVQRFLAEAVRPDAPETFAAAGEPIEVGELAAAGPLAGTNLCTEAVRVSSDARWLAVLHDPSACDPAGFGAAVLLFDLTTEPAPTVVYPTVASTDVAPVAPLFLAPPGGGEPGEMNYLEADGTLVRVSLPDDGEVEELDPILLDDLLDPIGLGTGGLDLVVAEADAFHTFRTGAPDEPVTLASDAELEAVVDAASLPNAPVVARSDVGIVVHTDLTQDDDAREPGELLVDGLADATVGPYGYAFLLAPNRIVAVDLLTYVGSTDVGDGDRLSSYVVPGIGGELPIAAPIAIDWIFGEVATEDP